MNRFSSIYRDEWRALELTRRPKAFWDSLRIMGALWELDPIIVGVPRRSQVDPAHAIQRTRSCHLGCDIAIAWQYMAICSIIQ